MTRETQNDAMGQLVIDIEAVEGDTPLIPACGPRPRPPPEMPAGPSPRENVTIPGPMAAVPSSYTRTAVSLHWLIAALVVSAFALGWVMTELAISPLKVKMYNWHKWVGITVLGLAAIRTLWRLTHTPPPLLPMPAWQQISARILHTLLYVVMFALPFSGWAYSNATGYPIVYLGLWRLPDLVARNKPLAAQLLDVHEILGWLLFAIVMTHVAAALKHHLVDRDDTLRRMLRWRANGSKSV